MCRLVNVESGKNVSRSGRKDECYEAGLKLLPEAVVLDLNWEQKA